MTCAELARYNLARLVAESGREHEDIAIRAWPMPPLATGKRRLAHVEVRRKKLRRYLAGEVTISWEAVDALARALEVHPVDFFRPRQVEFPMPVTVTIADHEPGQVGHCITLLTLTAALPVVAYGWEGSIEVAAEKIRGRGWAAKGTLSRDGFSFDVRTVDLTPPTCTSPAFLAAIIGDEWRVRGFVNLSIAAEPAGRDQRIEHHPTATATTMTTTRTPITIISSPDAAPTGRSLDVGAWLCHGKTIAGTLPPGTEALAEYAETLRSSAWADLDADRVGERDLGRLVRGHAHMLRAVGAVECVLVHDGDRTWSYDYAVEFPRGPKIRLHDLLSEVARRLTL